jgi:hypothetical protein
MDYGGGRGGHEVVVPFPYTSRVDAKRGQSATHESVQIGDGLQQWQIGVHVELFQPRGKHRPYIGQEAHPCWRKPGRNEGFTRGVVNLG